jgi:nitrate/nitrite transport system substrate-binding protein
MPATLDQDTIKGYSVGEPWNQQAVIRKIGVPVVTNYGIWKNNPEKVFGVTREWAEKYPNTAVAMTKALIRAGKWLDGSTENRLQAVKILSKSEYVGADENVIAASMTGTFEYAPGDKRNMPDFNVFFRYDATYPFFSDAIWFLTQMRRWGQIDEAKSDDWYHEIANKVYRPDIYMKAANALLAEGRLEASEVPQTDGFKAPDRGFIDGTVYDGRKPNEYLSKFEIGNQGGGSKTAAR